MILCPVEGVAGSVQTFIELAAGAGYGLTEPVLVPGSHNRFKPRGYRCWRDPTGVWHIDRPDGTEIKAA